MARRDKGGSVGERVPMDIGELKHRLEQGRGAKGYPAELRAAAIAYAVARRAEGAKQATVSKELGVSDRSLLSWGGPRREGGLTRVKLLTSFEPERRSARKTARKPAQEREPVREHEPVREREPARALIVECGPVRILGLDVDGVVNLLRGLK